MAAAIAPLLAADGVAISLQNGLGNVETLERRSGAERALGARVIFGATVRAPGRRARHRVRRPHRDRRARARPSSAARRGGARAGRRSSTAPASRRSYTDRLAALLWAKVFYNAALNPLGALLGVHYGALPEHPREPRAHGRGDRRGVRRRPRRGASRCRGRAPADYRDEFYGRLVPATYDHRSSMLQDLERGRRTEIDAINGAVWRRGAARGIETPVNETLTRLVHAVEAKRRRMNCTRARADSSTQLTRARRRHLSRGVLRLRRRARRAARRRCASPTSRTSSTPRTRNSSRAPRRSRTRWAPKPRRCWSTTTAAS